MTKAHHAVPSPRRRSRFAAVALAAFGCVLAAGCGATAGTAPASRFELFVLGIAQDGGVPHLGCEQPCCQEARASGRTLHPASLGVVDHETGGLALVEATPRIEEQVAMLHRLAGVSGRGRAPVDAVLLTHAHLGHYLGLLWFGREACASRALPVHCSPRMEAFLRGNGPWRQLVELQQVALQPFQPGVPFEPLPGLVVTAVQVPHRDEFSDTMAFRVRGPSRTVLFVPDVDAWERWPGLLERLFEGVDVAFVDGTFFDADELPERSRAEIPHPLMTDTMRALADFARAHPGAVRFLHLNHSNPALRSAAVVRRIEDAGFAVAAQGERVGL